MSTVAPALIEGNPRNFGFARMRLRHFRNVELRLGNSRMEARCALDLHRSALEARPLFAYLDAHWNEDPPLAEELENVFGHERFADLHGKLSMQSIS